MTLLSGPNAPLRALQREVYVGFDLGSPVPSVSWTRPDQATARDGWLVYRGSGTRPDITSGNGLLEAFLQLAHGTDDAIARFAETWGPLYVCDEHMLPVHHREPSKWVSSLVECGGVTVAGESATPLATMRYWSRQALAILRLGVAVRAGTEGDDGDWQAIADESLDGWRWDMRELWPSMQRRDENGELYWTTPSYGLSLLGSRASWRKAVRSGAADLSSKNWGLEIARQDLAGAIRVWLELGNVMPVFIWPRKGPDVLMGGAGMFAAVGVQIMLAVSRTDGLATCSACARVYVPRRRLRAHQRHYCAECTETGAPARDASAAFRKRKKEGQLGKARKR